jgi:integrase
MLALVNQGILPMGVLEARQELKKRHQSKSNKKTKGVSDHCESQDLLNLAEELFSSNKHTDKTLGLVIYTGVVTGLRINDILDLRSENLVPDIDGLHIKLIQQKGKVPFNKLVSKRLDDMLGEYISLNLITDEGDNHIFVNKNTGTKFTTHWVNKRFANLKKQLNWLEDKTFSTHSLRKTYAMTIYKYYGNDIVKARDALGHKSITTTQKYLNLDKKEKSLIHTNVVNDIFNAIS